MKEIVEIRWHGRGGQGAKTGGDETLRALFAQREPERSNRTMSKPKVYVETSVISYLTAAPSRDPLVAAYQQLTRVWWHDVLPQCEPYVSLVVQEEAARGDTKEAERRLDAISGIRLLSIDDDIHRLSELYFKKLGLPKRAAPDAYHLALATWHGMDYLVTWNCSHIASGRVRTILGRLNAEAGIATPEICTPEELMEV